MDIEQMLRDEVKTAKKAAHGGDVWAHNRALVDFSSNVNPFGPSKKVLKGIKESLWKLSYYPDPGSNELKDALSNYLGVDTGNIAVGNGSTELVKNFLELVIEKGDRVIIPEPTFSEYEVYSRLYGANIKHIFSKRKDDFSINVEEIIEKINDKTKIVFICNPNNPTGKILDPQGLERIISSARDHGSFVFVDEAYIEFTESEGMSQKIGEYDNLFVLRSITKFFSLPGMRAGYGVGEKRLINYLEKIRVPWNVNILAQTATVESLKDEEFIKTSRDLITEEKDFLFEEISRLDGVEILSSDTNFFLIDLKKSGIKSNELKKRLIEKGLLIRDCSSFNGLDESFIRISVRGREENSLLVNSLREVLAGA
ncbi:MAG: histidinol-phosphate transaminase [Candidatus Hydrothermarchaeales archaeon]